MELIHDGRGRRRHRPSLLGRLGAGQGGGADPGAAIDGIEVFYPPHTREETAHLLGLCEELDLTPTASSDYHGPTHKTFSRFGAYRTFGLGEPQIPPRP